MGGVAEFFGVCLEMRAALRFLGWSFRHPMDRLKWIANNSRFLLLPEWHVPNWQHPGLCHCAADGFRTTGWNALVFLCFYWKPWSIQSVSTEPSTERQTGSWWVTAKAINASAKATAIAADRRRGSVCSVAAKKYSRALVAPNFASTLPDRSPENAVNRRSDEILAGVFQSDRRSQTRRRQAPSDLPVVLSIAAGAILCGMRGYKAIAEGRPWP